MIRSMTGWGEAEREIPQGRLRVEMKTVNHRFFNASLRLPPGLDRYESDIQGWLRPFIPRGHVHFAVSFERGGVALEADQPDLDLDRARLYKALLERLKEELDLPGKVDVTMVARFSEIFRAPEPGRRAIEVDPAVLKDAAEEAARAVVTMRETEGGRLQLDLEERLRVIAHELDRVGHRAPERLVAERDRIRETIRTLLEKEDVDEDRLAREVAYLAERWDVNEEIVRFRSHIALFRETLAAAYAEPVGKRLGFIVQEMHREANTIGSKANDGEIGHAAVAMKEEIERLREQLENVE